MKIAGREVTKRHAGIGGIVGAVGLVGVAINGAIDLDRKLDARSAESDSLWVAVGVLREDIARLEKRLGVRAKKRAAAARPERVGLARKVFRLLF